PDRAGRGRLARGRPALHRPGRADRRLAGRGFGRSGGSSCHDPFAPFRPAAGKADNQERTDNGANQAGQQGRPSAPGRRAQPAPTGARRERKNYRLLVESVNDYAMIMLDPKGNVASWNPGAERIKGYRAEEIIGQHFSRFYPGEDVQGGKPEEELR